MEYEEWVLDEGRVDLQSDELGVETPVEQRERGDERERPNGEEQNQRQRTEDREEVFAPPSRGQAASAFHGVQRSR